MKEIDTMIKVSETKSELKRFVVNMLGCCRLEEPILLVVEFVPHGDLLSYLRKMKKKMVSKFTFTAKKMSKQSIKCFALIKQTPLIKLPNPFFDDYSKVQVMPISRLLIWLVTELPSNCNYRFNYYADFFLWYVH